MCELLPVSFHGDTIFCVEFDSQPYAPIKPIVVNMGLDWGAQSTKLRNNKERWGIAIIAIPSESGEQETTCLPVRKLPAWLASINPKKVRPELRAKIELYQNECDDALWDYWMKGKAERKENPAPYSISSVEDLYALRDSVLAGLAGAEREKAAARIRRRLERNFGSGYLPNVPKDKWQAAAILITAPACTVGNSGLLRKARIRQSSSFSNLDTVEAIPDFDTTRIYKDFLSALDTASELQGKLAQVEQQLGPSVACIHRVGLSDEKMVCVRNAQDCIQIARANLKACEYALRSFARIRSTVNFLDDGPVPIVN